jgi:peroxiredoxin
MLPLGTEAPAFTLPDTVGNQVSLSDAGAAPAVLVMFLCNHCPYVKHVADSLAVVTASLIDRGVAVYGISSNDVEAYPDDSPERMAEEADRRGYPFPYLYDESQEVARAYDAACTPDFYLFDGDRRLVYRGQYDGSRPSSGDPVTGADLLAAVDALLDGRPVSDDQRPSLGCSIKWRN